MTDYKLAAWVLTEQLTKQEATTRGRLSFCDPQNSARAAARAKQSADLRTVLTHYHANPGQEIHGWNEIPTGELK